MKTMKKSLISVLVLFFLITPAISHAGFFSKFNFNWKYLSAQVKTSISTNITHPISFSRGDKDPEILYIQNFLTKNGLYNGKESGLLGPKTEAALKVWQAKNKLSVTGILDEKTAESIVGLSKAHGDDRGGDFPTSIKVFLGGPYNPVTGKMSTGLNTHHLIPLGEPYSSNGYNLDNSGAEITDPNILNVTGDNAIVDWVVVDLRDNGNQQQTAFMKAGLLQSDGDIVDVDGISPLMFPAGNYYVVIHHRNHLPIMSANFFANWQAGADLTSIPLYGANAVKIVNGVQVMWPGDVNQDNLVKYTGVNNDRDMILSSVGATMPTNTISGYLNQDVNMDGVVKYTGANNDRDIILQTIGGVTPNNILQAQIPESSGMLVSLYSTSATVLPQGSASDIGTFVIKFNVMALDNDIVVSSAQQLADGMHTMGEGVEYMIGSDNNQGTTTPNALLTCETNCNPVSGGFMIQEGDTSRFNLTTAFQPTSDGFFRTYLNSINYGVYMGGTWMANKFFGIDLGQDTLFTTPSVFLNAN